MEKIMKRSVSAEYCLLVRKNLNGYKNIENYCLGDRVYMAVVLTLHKLVGVVFLKLQFEILNGGSVAISTSINPFQ